MPAVPRLQTGANTQGREAPIRRHARQGANKICSGMPGKQNCLAPLIVLRDAFADLVERRDFAGQPIGERENVHGVRPGNRPGEWFIGRQAKGGFGEGRRRAKFFRPQFAREGRGHVNGQSFLFGDGGEIFGPGRINVKNGVGEIICVLARVVSGAVTNQFLADFLLRFGG